MSLTSKFFVTVSLPVLACLTVLSVMLYRVSSSELEREQEQRLLARVELVRTLIDDSVALVKSDLTILMANYLLEQYLMYADVGELDYEEDLRATLEDNFLSASHARPRYASLRLFTLEGEGIVNITNQQRAYKYPDPQKTEWFNEAKELKENSVYVSRVHPCPEHGAPSIFMSKLFYYWGKPRLIASIHIHAQDYFAPVLSEINLEQASEVHIVDGYGGIIVHSAVDRLGLKGGDPEVVRQLMEAGEKVRIIKEEIAGIRENRVYFSTGLDGAVGVISQQQAVISAPVNKLKKRLTGVAALIASILFVLIYFSIRTVIRPLAKLEQTTKEIAAGNLDARVRIARKDEIGSLSASFDKMADNLQQSESDLRKALAEVKTLSGFLPICASCKKIRDDKGYWNQIETYIRDHSDAEFSHGICPDCAEKLYGEISRFKEEQNG